MSRQLVDILTELNLDEEFAQRFRVGGPSAKPLVRYFVDRGVDELQAELLAMAYLVGAQHTSEQMGRVLDRIVKQS